jgi:hypothetical protein
MELTLLTYDCFVILDTGYIHNPCATEFAKELINQAKKFAKECKVPLQTVHWLHVTESDEIKEHLLIYSKVPQNWEPTSNTRILDDKINPMYPESAFTFRSWVKNHGSIGVGTNKNNHKLFKAC